MLVATPEGRVSHYLFGVEYSPKDLRLALVDAAGGKIGNTVDQVLLFCYQYDPETGRYSASILSVLRLLAVATVLAIGGFILTTSMRRR
jgi:protein SCO1/2